jgi:hypothetical protein
MRSNVSVTATFTRTGPGGGTGRCTGSCRGVTVFGGSGTGVIAAPPGESCLRRHELTVSVNRFHSVTYKQITVYVNNSQVKRLSGRRRKARVVLRRWRSRRVIVKIVVKSTRWTVVGTRTYRSCGG